MMDEGAWVSWQFGTVTLGDDGVTPRYYFLHYTFAHMFSLEVLIHQIRPISYGLILASTWTPNIIWSDSWRDLIHGVIGYDMVSSYFAHASQGVPMIYLYLATLCIYLLRMYHRAYQ